MTMHKTVSIAAIAGMIGGVAFAAGDMTNMIQTDGVKIDGDTATFQTVRAAKDGYLVIHATQDGKPVAPASIGHAAVTEGKNQDVAVSIDETFDRDAKYIAMLHVESNGNDSYDFGKGMTDVDTPAKKSGEVVAVPFSASGNM